MIAAHLKLHADGYLWTLFVLTKSVERIIFNHSVHTVVDAGQLSCPLCHVSESAVAIR